MADSTGKIMGVFTKLVTRLEKVAAREQVKVDEITTSVMRLQEQQKIHMVEKAAADKYAEKITKFLEE